MTSEIGVAVVGLGHWGPNLVRCLNIPGRSRVVSVVDSSPRRLEGIANLWPHTVLTSSIEDVLADANVQAVALATPTSTHFPLAMQVLEGGRHVLVEKPLTTSSQTSERLISLAAARGLVLMVGHTFLFNSAVAHLANAIQNGDLGLLYNISALRTNLGPIRGDVNAAWDLAPHDISIVNEWLGTPPTHASANGGSWINPGLEDVVYATLYYPNDVMVNLHLSWLSPRKQRQITVVGDKAMAIFDDTSVAEPVRFYEKQVSNQSAARDGDNSYAAFRAEIWEGQVTIPRVVMHEPLQVECAHFVDCVIQSSTPKSDGMTGLNVVRVLEAISRSLKRGGCREQVSND